MAAGLASGNPPSQAGDVHGRTSRSVAVQRRFTHSVFVVDVRLTQLSKTHGKLADPSPCLVNSCLLIVKSLKNHVKNDR